MRTTKIDGKTRQESRKWPRRALGIFVLFVVVVYALIFFTGNKQPTPQLGIDLQGGTRITLVPQGEEPTSDQLAQARTILENRVNGMGVSGASVVTDGNTLVITVPGEDTDQARAVGQTSQLVFRPVEQLPMPDIAALSDTLGEMANRWVEYDVISPENAKQAIDQVSQALSAGGGDEGFTAPEITATPKGAPANSIEAAERRQETTQILRDDRQSTDPTTQAAAATLVQAQCQPAQPGDEATGDGEASTGVDPLAGTDDPALPLVSCDPSSQSANLLAPSPLVKGETDEVNGDRLTGAYIDDDAPINGGPNPDTGQMEVSFSFKSGPGDQTWSDLTNEYLERQVAVTLDSQIISAPVIRTPTPPGRATSITGDFTNQEAQDLANNLRYGALPLSFAGEDGEQGGTEQIVPASLGEASLKAGLIAGLVGFALIAVFVFVYYRLYGLISLVTLAAAGVLVYGSLVLLGRWIGYSLDLSGVAGLVIGLGATADSFVVMYERVKDEVREGHTFRSASRRGWERARKTIVTGNMVTLIGSVVIYFLAVGEVKGFAFTLGLTTVFDLVVTFLVTAPLMQLAGRRPFWAKPAVNGMGKVFELARVRRRNTKRITYAEGASSLAAADAITAQPALNNASVSSSTAIDTSNPPDTPSNPAISGDDRDEEK